MGMRMNEREESANGWALPTANVPQVEIDSVRLALASLGEQVGRTGREALARFNQQMHEAVIAVHEATHRRFQEQLAPVLAEMQRSVTEMEPGALAMGRQGWTIPMWAPLPWIRLISDSVPAQDLDAVFAKEYDDVSRERELLATVCSHESLERWRSLLVECSTCYRADRYLIVVPAALAVLEGAIAEAAERLRTRAMPGQIVKTRLEELNPGIERLAWVSLHGFTSAVFGSHGFAADPPALINRHWVLHGRAQPRWGKVDCLRLFQALETLAVVTT
jgi:hypothetical protein